MEIEIEPIKDAVISCTYEKKNKTVYINIGRNGSIEITTVTTKEVKK